MRRISVAMLAVVALGTLMTGAVASAEPLSPAESLDLARQVTFPYRDIAVAEADGYANAHLCFDSDAGGMGDHWVNPAYVDDKIEVAKPEALVYADTAYGRHLVAVEYFTPAGDNYELAPPDPIFDQTFILNEDLHLWTLHVWLWWANPNGIYAPYNPLILDCPAT